MKMSNNDTVEKIKRPSILPNKKNNLSFIHLKNKIADKKKLSDK
jgi:hypothetical protein